MMFNTNKLIVLQIQLRAMSNIIRTPEYSTSHSRINSIHDFLFMNHTIPK